MPFATIAEQLKISPQRAYQIYREALDAIPAPSVAEHRTEQRALIDYAISELLKIADNANVSKEVRMKALDGVRAWVERESKLLGTDAKTAYDVTINETTSADIEFAEMIHELAARNAAEEAQQARDER